MPAARVCPDHRCGRGFEWPATSLALEFEQKPRGVFWAGSKICGPLRVIRRGLYRPPLDASRIEAAAAIVLEIEPEPGSWSVPASDRCPLRELLQHRMPGERCVRLTLPLRWLLDGGGDALRALADAGLWLSADAACDALVIRYLRLAAAALPRGCDAD